jgi:putative endonuclease
MLSKSKTKNRLRGKHSYIKGFVAELLAVIYLFFKGYRVLTTRYKTPVGEIDIVAKKNGYLVFIEVKYRPSFEIGISVISSKAKKRIIRASEYYIMKEKSPYDSNIRFDAIIISPPFSIRHIVNAWTL